MQSTAHFQRHALGLLASLMLAGCADADPAPATITAPKQHHQRCDVDPIGIATEDYWLKFKVPDGLMPDARFDGRHAELHVHRVRPVYERPDCRASHAAVLVHGRTIAGPPTFDLDFADGALSVQHKLAWAGIDTFAPSFLGYGLSTRFEELADPCNASLPGVVAGVCPTPELGCDFGGINPLNQQGQFPPTTPAPARHTTLWTHPLGGVRCAHSYGAHFAGTDVWVRDLAQVIDDAIRRAGLPPGSKVTLVAYSFGAQRVGRALNPDNPVVPTGDIIAKVDKVVFLAPLVFGLGGADVPAEEPAQSALPTFPFIVVGESSTPAGWNMGTREAACGGHVVPGSQDAFWDHNLALETVAEEWGGDGTPEPTGLIQAPTFSTYGLNRQVAGRLAAPTLVIQGLEDSGLPPVPPIPAGNPPTAHRHSCALFEALPPAMDNKVLVQISCASHQLMLEGCGGARCDAGTPYGGPAPWGGPHVTVSSALIEWIRHGTFDGHAAGRFLIDDGGVVHDGLAATCP